MFADPRGPIRIITKTGPVVLDCGHRPNLNPLHVHRVGDECRCFRCGRLAAGAEPTEEETAWMDRGAEESRAC